MSEDKEQKNEELVEKAAEELAWLFVSIIENNLDKKKEKLSKKYENENSKKNKAE